MLEAVGGALIVAALSAITFMAYQHPKAFPGIALPLVLILGFWMFSGTAWNAGILRAEFAVDDFIQAEKTKEADESLDNAKISIWLTWGAPTALSFYLVFLMHLPQILGMQNEVQKKHDKEDR